MLSNLRISAQIAATLSASRVDGSAPKVDYNAGLFKKVPSDANLLYTNGFAIPTANSQSLDLSGSLLDALGVSCVFAKVYAVEIVNLSTTTGQNIQIGGDTNHVPLFGAPADYLTIGPNGVFLAANCLDGWTVTASTGDVIKIANSAGGQTINVAVAILGKTA
ncbi:hypothetical protein [Planctomyces sp. SH-PL14]|uniref:hypothetical protein n=1 Tax=Planctomyces sp. SH-PL14 TaxID=1632864 RepID=UPI00078DC392|nr:hypothetical protein [Planctomyces sp. SH-PL14]AMV18259.1 hypothetical protein VT03_10245 [Planctomyces sp. SH-PL14]